MQGPGNEARVHTVEVLNMGDEGEAAAMCRRQISSVIILLGTISDACPPSGGRGMNSFLQLVLIFNTSIIFAVFS